MIRTPFNFVPLSEHVAIDWNAENISHDIPFEDGISGTIDLTITALSDIFIRNGHTRQDAEAKNEEYNSFSHITGPDGKPLYFIPGSSIKGEVRNILEILSFSKLTIDEKKDDNLVFKKKHSKRNVEDYNEHVNKEILPNLPISHQQKSPDLAQCIFGFTDANMGKTNSLKGRVQFGNAFAVEPKKCQPAEIQLTLEQPKASYYPIYIKQQGKMGKCTTYKDLKNGTLIGWKRYYLRKSKWAKKTNVPLGKEKGIDTIIRPLKEGTVFKSTVSFHNLRPFELGALLSALTFHHTDGCLHQLGQAKPYGYGKCLYEISLHANKLKDFKEAKKSELSNSDIDYYLALFEKSMIGKLGQDWITSPQITELLTLAKQEVDDEESFKYMELPEYKEVKSHKLYLSPFSEIENKTSTGKSLIYILERQAIKSHLEAIKVQYENKIKNAGKDKNSLKTLKTELQEKKRSAKDAREQELFATLYTLVLQSIRNYYEDVLKADYNDLTSLKVLEEELKKEKEDSKVEEEQKLLNDLYNQVVTRKIELMEPKAKTPEEIIKAGIKAFIPKGSSFNQVANRLKKWLDALEETGRQRVLSAEDADYAFQKMKEAYDAANKNEKKKWANGGKYYKNCVKIVGKDLSDVWFSKINEESK